MVDYRLDPKRERFFVYAPPGYSPGQPWGVIVYISPVDVPALPRGWEGVLARNQLLFVCAQSAGNECEPRRRNGLAVMAALEMLANYSIDAQRVYVAGLSGGARVAGTLAFYQGDVFRGTIQSCGCDFVQPIAGANPEDLINPTPAELREAKAHEKFVFITGPQDYCQADVIDVYKRGYAAQGFQCKLLDVPGMGHQDCDASTLQRALDFLKP